MFSKPYNFFLSLLSALCRKVLHTLKHGPWFMIKLEKFPLKTQQDNRDSAVDIVARLVAGNRGIVFRFQSAVRDLSVLRGVQTGCGAQPAIYTMGTDDLFPGVKWFGRDADHTSPPSSELSETLES
jgi:hypothetical protein